MHIVSKQTNDADPEHFQADPKPPLNSTVDFKENTVLHFYPREFCLFPALQGLFPHTGPTIDAFIKAGSYFGFTRIRIRNTK
jgi:hypothetical protein